MCRLVPGKTNCLTFTKSSYKETQIGGGTQSSHVCCPPFVKTKEVQRQGDLTTSVHPYKYRFTRWQTVSCGHDFWNRCWDKSLGQFIWMYSNHPFRILQSGQKSMMNKHLICTKSSDDILNFMKFQDAGWIGWTRGSSKEIVLTEVPRWDSDR